MIKIKQTVKHEQTHLIKQNDKIKFKKYALNLYHTG